MCMIHSVQAALNEAARALAAAGIENPRLEARLLLAHALGRTQEALLRDRDAPVEAAGLAPLLARRVAREPLALIVGCREVWGLPFVVAPATLVPRPETETLVEAAIAALPDRDKVRSVLDLGTGTGCLLLAALTEFPLAWGLGLDLIPAAAALAQRNAAMLGLRDRAAFACGDWASGIAGRFDLILSNPPYVETRALGGLIPEVARYEPATALDGGADGLFAYRRIVPELPRLLQPAGAAVLELGEGQAGPVAALARESGLDVAAACPDLGGVIRALVLRPPAG
jgi:release factor glutamine methyltransferase